MKILAYHVQPYELDAFEQWQKETGIEVVLEKGLLTKDTIDMAKGFDGVCTQQVIPVKDEEIFKKMKEFGLKQIASRTAGVDMFALDMAKNYGIAITNVPRYSPNAIAEMAVSHALQLTRNIKKIEKCMDEGNYVWDKSLLSKEIRNCTVGFIGTGRIGLTTAKLYKGFGAKIIGYDKIRTDEAAEIIDFKDTLEEVLKESDIVSLHLPLMEETHHIINKDNLKLMREDAILINTGRGGLVNIDDLVEALENGKLAGAGIDVLETETLYVNQKIDPDKVKGTAVEKLRKMDNVVFTPHYAFFTDEAVGNMVTTALDNIKIQEETGKLRNAMNM